MTETELRLREVQDILLQEISDHASVMGTAKRRNVSPSKWGEHGWKFLDRVVEGYPVRPSHEDQVRMFDFLTSLGHVLPCRTCRKNYGVFVRGYPPIDYVASKRLLKVWFKAYKRHKV